MYKKFKIVFILSLVLVLTNSCTTYAEIGWVDPDKTNIVVPEKPEPIITSLQEWLDVFYPEAYFYRDDLSMKVIISSTNCTSRRLEELLDFVLLEFDQTDVLFNVNEVALKVFDGENFNDKVMNGDEIRYSKSTDSFILEYIFYKAQDLRLFKNPPRSNNNDTTIFEEDISSLARVIAERINTVIDFELGDTLQSINMYVDENTSAFDLFAITFMTFNYLGDADHPEFEEAPIMDFYKTKVRTECWTDRGAFLWEQIDNKLKLTYSLRVNQPTPRYSTLPIEETTEYVEELHEPEPHEEPHDELREPERYIEEVTEVNNKSSFDLGSKVSDEELPISKSEIYTISKKLLSNKFSYMNINEPDLLGVLAQHKVLLDANHSLEAYTEFIETIPKSNIVVFIEDPKAQEIFQKYSENEIGIKAELNGETDHFDIIAVCAEASTVLSSTANLSAMVGFGEISVKSPTIYPFSESVVIKSIIMLDKNVEVEVELYLLFENGLISDYEIIY